MKILSSSSLKILSTPMLSIHPLLPKKLPPIIKVLLLDPRLRLRLPISNRNLLKENITPIISQTRIPRPLARLPQKLIQDFTLYIYSGPYVFAISLKKPAWVTEGGLDRRGFFFLFFLEFRCRREPTARLLLQVTSNVFSESSFLTFFLRGFIPFSSRALKKANALGWTFELEPL
jgi:hypothetical protein